MKTQTENLDDIVFEKRNKNYGAYQIRKSYYKHLTSALIISFTIFLIGMSIPLIANYLKKITTKNIEENIEVSMIKPPDMKDIPPPPLPPPPPVNVPKQLIFTVPKIVDEKIDSVFITEDIDKFKPPTIDTNFSISIDTSITKKIVPIPILTPEIYTWVPEMPIFPGGDEARINFLRKNLKYPQMAKEAGIQGTVWIYFVIDETGAVTDVKVLRGIGSGCDEEALRVVSKMPKWTPGKQTGNPVKVQFHIPIKFSLKI